MFINKEMATYIMIHLCDKILYRHVKEQIRAIKDAMYVPLWYC